MEIQEQDFIFSVETPGPQEMVDDRRIGRAVMVNMPPWAAHHEHKGTLQRVWIYPTSKKEIWEVKLKNGTLTALSHRFTLLPVAAKKRTTRHKKTGK